MSPISPSSLSPMDPEVFSGSKVIRTFRMPRDLVGLLGIEANRRRLDLTALILRILHGYLGHFGLPEAAVAQLEFDRETLKMDRSQYLAHLLYHRSLAVREYGAGFDDPHAPAMPRPPERPLGVTGGGAHRAAEGMTPGAGVWPYGVSVVKTPKR